jgi:hypothetical protein
VDLLPPEEVLEVWRNATGRGKYDEMWDALGDRTIQNIASGAHTMALLWESAWKHGGGDGLPRTQLVEIRQRRLQDLYFKKTFVPSFRLSDPDGYKSVL